VIKTEVSGEAEYDTLYFRNHLLDNMQKIISL